MKKVLILTTIILSSFVTSAYSSERNEYTEINYACTTLYGLAKKVMESRIEGVSIVEVSEKWVIGEESAMLVIDAYEHDLPTLIDKRYAKDYAEQYYIKCFKRLENNRLREKQKGAGTLVR